MKNTNSETKGAIAMERPESGLDEVQLAIYAGLVSSCLLFSYSLYAALS